jgi:hypothetical protein
MFKKLSLFIFIISLAFGYYFLNRPAATQNEKIYNDIQTPSTTVVFKNKALTPADSSPQKIIKTPDKNFEEYDQNEKAWLGKIELLLGENDFQYYTDLREKNDQEKMQAYKEFHEYLRQKHGDNFSYNISEDQSVREKDINTKYTRMLLKKIGEEKFKMYLKTRDEYNEELQKQSKDGQALVFEF